jgi:hypothetical protein
MPSYSPVEVEEIAATSPAGVCKWAKPIDGVTNLQVRNPKRVQGFFPAEGLGVSPNFLVSPQEWGPGVQDGSLMPALG